MRPEDEERIKTQISDTEILIEREIKEFEARHPTRKAQGNTESKAEGSNGVSKETVGEPATKSPSVPTLALHDDTTNPQPDQVKTEKHTPEEHNGEVVVENEEDTVIY